MKTVKLDGRSYSVSKLACVGRNYAQHAVELGNAVPDNSDASNMVVFFKPGSAIAGSAIIPRDTLVHYETELCFLVESRSIVAVGIGLDLTMRELQGELKRAGLPWERAKAFDGSAVLSDFVAIRPSQLSDLSLGFVLNGREVQRGGVKDMLFSPDVIVQEVLSFATLEDGDIIMSGTPEGVGPLEVGDRCELTVWQGDLVLIEHSFCVEVRD